MDSLEMTFTGSGGETLVGTLDLPPKEPETYGVMAHCFTGGRNHPATKRVAAELTARGMAVLRFDFTGLGDSGGDFADSTFSSNVADVVRAADWLRENHGAPTMLVGHSLGGAAVIPAALDVPEVAAVATIAAPASPEHVIHLFEGILDQVRTDGSAEVVLAGKRITISEDFVRDLEETRISEAARNLDRPLLILHSPQDELVELTNANGIFRAARHPKSFIALDGANHLLTKPRHAKRAAQLIAAWGDPYLPDTFTPEKD